MTLPALFFLLKFAFTQQEIFTWSKCYCPGPAADLLNPNLFGGVREKPGNVPFLQAFQVTLLCPWPGTHALAHRWEGDNVCHGRHMGHGGTTCPHLSLAQPSDSGCPALTELPDLKIEGNDIVCFLGLLWLWANICKASVHPKAKALFKYLCSP